MRNAEHHRWPACSEPADEFERVRFGDPAVSDHRDSASTCLEMGSGRSVPHEVRQRRPGVRRCGRIQVDHQTGAGRCSEAKRGDAMKHRVGTRKTSDGHGGRSYEMDAAA